MLLPYADTLFFCLCLRGFLLEAAAFLLTNELISALFYKEHLAAPGADLVCGHIPGGEIAIGIL